jgi:excisionase family DNA binding protein
MQMDERLSYKPAEAARALGVGRTTLYELVRANAIPFFRLNGKSIRIPIAALRDWMSQQTAPVKSSLPYGSKLPPEVCEPRQSGGDAHSLPESPRNAGLPHPTRSKRA